VRWHITHAGLKKVGKVITKWSAAASVSARCVSCLPSRIRTARVSQITSKTRPVTQAISRDLFEHNADRREESGGPCVRRRPEREWEGPKNRHKEALTWKTSDFVDLSDAETR
jgi:hypothetical protein